MSLPKVSPSRLDRLATCSKFVFDDRETKSQEARQEAMDAGTRFHELMEEIAKHENPTLRINEIPDFLDRKCAEYAWAQVAGILAAGASIVGVEMQLPESSTCRRGFADLVLRYGNTLVIVDWKLTRAQGEHAMQMRAYAIAALEADPEIDLVRAVIVAPAVPHTEEMEFRREDLDAQRKIVLDLMELVQNPFAPANPGDACPGCLWAGRCPAQARELVPVSVEAAMPVALSEMLNPATPEGRARRRYFCDWLASAVDGIKADDLEYVKAGNEPPPGYKLITKAGRSSIPAESVPAAIDKLAAAGYSIDTIHAACTLYTSKLAKAVAPVLGEKEEEVRKQLDALVAEFQINGEPSTYLARTSKKAMADLFKATLEPKQLKQ